MVIYHVKSRIFAVTVSSKSSKAGQHKIKNRFWLLPRVTTIKSNADKDAVCHGLVPGRTKKFFTINGHILYGPLINGLT